MSMLDEYKALQDSKANSGVKYGGGQYGGGAGRSASSGGASNGRKSIVDEYIEKNGSSGLNEKYVEHMKSRQNFYDTSTAKKKYRYSGVSESERKKMATDYRFATQNLMGKMRTGLYSANDLNGEMESVDSMRKKLDLANTFHKTSNKKYDDTFTGQFGANYTSGRLGQDISLAWNDYIDDPTEENKQYAQYLEEILKRFQANNEKALDDEGLKAPWISKDFANYLPQFLDQIGYSAESAIPMAAAGGVIGSIPGAVKGLQAGIVAGSGKYSYDTMRGAAFKNLIDLGVDEQTAIAAAKDEAVVSALIEMGDTALDVLSFGIGGMAKLLGKGTIKKVGGEVAEQGAKKFLKALGKYGLSVGQEALEEYAQESVSIANEERTTSGAYDPNAGGISNKLGLALDSLKEDFDFSDTDNNERKLEAAKGGAKIGAIMGAAGTVYNKAGQAVVENAYYNKNYGDSIEDLVAESLEITPDNKLAQNIQKKLENNKKVSGIEVGKLVRQNEADMAAQDAEIIRSSVAQKLTDYGEQGDVKPLSEAIRKLVSGEKGTKEEYQLIAQSKYGQRVLNEMDPENIKSGAYNTEWSEKLGTNRINPEEYSRLIQNAQNEPESVSAASEGNYTADTAKAAQSATAQTESEIPEPLAKDTNVKTEVETKSVTEDARNRTDVSHETTLEDASRNYGAQAQAFVHTYQPGQDVASYDAAYRPAFEYGRSGVGLNYVKNNPAVTYLTYEQTELAYAAGKAAAEGYAEKLNANIRKNIKSGGVRRKGTVKGYGVKIEDLRKTFNDPQNKAYRVLTKVAEATGINIVLYKSEANSKGVFTDAEGRFSHDTNTIYIDINSGLRDLGDVGKLEMYTMLRTFTHEFTHFLEKWDPKQYNQFREMVFQAMNEKMALDTKAGEAQLTVDDLIEAKQKAYRESGKVSEDFSYEEASREVMADAMTDILPDSKFIENLYNQNRTLFDKIVEKLKEFIEDLNSYFADLSSDGKIEADYLKEKNADGTVKYLQSIVDAFDKIAEEAVENYQANLSEIIAPQEEHTGSLKPDDGGIDFSIRENKNITARTVKYFNEHRSQSSHISEEELNTANDIVSEMAEYMEPYLDITNNNGGRYLPEEILGKTTFKNGSYGKTIENTTICFRTLSYIDFTNEIKKRIGRPLTVEESFLASQMLYDIAKEPQCLYCYVSLDRKAYDGFLLEYTKQRDAAMEKYRSADIDPSERLKPQAKKKSDRTKDQYKLGDSALEDIYREYLNGREDSPNQRERFNMWIDAENGDGFITNADLTTEEIRSEVKNRGGSFAQQIDDAEKYAQGASWAKKLEQYRSYNGDLLSMSPNMVRNLNKHYGLRFYSFSEYTPAFIVENMQQIRDASVKGLYGLAYTKKPDFARIFAKTGMNINISVFGRMDNGNVVPDTLQGADWEEVKQLRKEHQNVGAVFVATNDQMTEWALSQDWIDVVIPFHIVRTGANVAEFYKWVNNTKDQADVDASGKNKTISPAEFHNDRETYMRLIEERGLTPRFAKWIDNPNYMKLVNETRLSDLESVKLHPDFDLDAAKKSFDTFVQDGGYYGNWYEDGVDYEGAVNTVANDVLSGKRANEVDYGRQDFDASVAMKNRRNRRHGQSLQIENTAGEGKVQHLVRVTNPVTLDKLKKAEREGVKSFSEITKDSKEGVVKVYRAMQAQPVDMLGNVIPNASVQRIVSTDPLIVEAKVFTGTGRNKKAEVITAPAKLFSPMAGANNGVWRNPINLNEWEMSEGHLERATTQIDKKTGKPKIDTNKKNASYGEVAYYFGLEKGGVDDNGKPLTDVPARYNPYVHTSLSALNDQFSSGNKRPELVTVETLVPVFHINSGERLPGAKDRVGAMSWHSGPTSSRLAKVDKARVVILSRYDKPIRVVPDSEVAASIAKTIGDSENISIQESTVTPSLSKELKALGISVLNAEDWARYAEEHPVDSFGKKGKVQFEVRYPTYTEEDIKNNSVKLQNMEPVAELTGNELGSRSIPLNQRVKEYFDSLGNNVYSEQFGDVAIVNSSVRSEFRHGNTTIKVATYAAIPSVIQNGVVIYTIKKNERAGLERIVVAAPVLVGNPSEKMYVGVMLQRDPQNQRLYLHDVVTDKELAESSSEHLNTTGPNATNSKLFTTDILLNALSVKEISTESQEKSSKDQMAIRGGKQMEDDLNALKRERSDIEEQIDLAYMNDLSDSEVRKLENRLTKVNADIDKLVAEERKASVLTPMQTILDNLSNYRRSDLESLAEQISDGAWDDYEELSRADLEDSLREAIEGRELSPLEMQSRKFGMYVRPVDSANSQNQIRSSDLSNTDVLIRAAEAVGREDGRYTLSDGERDALNIFLGKANTLKDAKSKRLALLDRKHGITDGKETLSKAEKQELRKVQNNLDTVNAQIKRAEDELARVENTKVIKKILKQARTVVERDVKAQNLEHLRTARDSRYSTILRGKIGKTASEFRQMILHPTDSRYAPVGLMQSCLDVAMMLDTSGEREDTKAKAKFNSMMDALGAIKDQYEEMARSSDSDYALEYDPDFAYMVDQLRKHIGGKPIRDLTYTELEDIHRILIDIKSMLNDAKYQIGKADKITNYSVGESIIREAQSVKPRTKAEQKIDASFRLTGSTLRNVRRIAQYDDNAAIVKLFDDLNEGIKKKNAFMMESDKMFSQFVGERFRNAANEVKQYNTGKRTIEMTEMEAMQAVLTWERESVGKTNHMMRDGIAIPDHELLRKGKYEDAFAKATLYSNIEESEIIAIASTFDEWAQDYMDTARKFFNDTSKKAINDTTLKIKHRPVALSAKYIPIEVDKNYLASELEGVKFDATIEGMGMLKSVVEGASNPIVIRGLNNIVENHTERVGQLYGLAIPVRNFNKAFGIRQIGGTMTPKKAIGLAWGADDVKLIEQAVTDLQTRRSHANDILSKGMRKMQGKFVEATLLSNISVTIKQAASYSTAGLYLSQKALAPYQTTIAELFANNESEKAKALFAEIDAHTPEHYIRRKGMSMQEISTVAQDQSKVVRFMDEKLPDAANPLKWIQNMDVATTAALWLAAKKQVELDGTKPTDSEYWNKVTALYEKVIEDTQPMYDVLHRPEIQKTTNELVKNILMFRTQPLQNSGILYDAAGELAQAKKSGDAESVKKASSKFKSAVTSQIASLAVFATMTMIAYAVRNRMGRYKDDEDELTVPSVMGRVLGDMAGNAAQLVLPLGGDVVSGFIEKRITGSNYGGEISVPVIDRINDYISDFNSVWKDFAEFNDGGKDDLAKDAGTFSMDVAGLFGIPANNVYNIFRGIIGNAGDITGHPVKWATDQSAPSVKTVNTAFNNGHTENAKKKIDAIIQNSVESGKTEDDAKKSVKSGMSSYWKPLYQKAYQNGNEDEMKRIRKIMNESGVFGSVDEIISTCAKWKYAEWDTDGNGLSQDDVSFALESGNYSAAEKERIWNELGYKKDYSDVQDKAQARVTLDQNAVTYNSANWESGLTDNSLSDSDKDTLVNAYGGTWFAEPYKNLRSGGYSPSAAYNLLSAMDADGNHSIKQAEAYDVLKNYSDAEAQRIWSDFGWTTSYGKYKAKHS